MSTVLLGTLVTGNLHDAWPNEAHHFTPWLAEHLDEIGELIGIPLEVEDTEVSVGSFRADILARNTLDDSVVLIENQLERTDHGHLGQILSYLTGLNAQTVVWVAAHFREEHLSALRWLNEHTSDPYAFFAVRVKVVRIGDSPLAPVFEVVERPNHWDRRVQEMVAPAIVESMEWREQFWRHYLSRFPDAAAFGPATKGHNRWQTHEASGLFVTLFISKKGAGIYIRGKFGVTPEALVQQLSPVRETLARALGSEVWNNASGHFFSLRCPLCSPLDPANRDAISDWLYAENQKFMRALDSCPAIAV